MRAEEEESLPLFIVTLIGVEDSSDLGHDVDGVHRARRLHIPRETQGTRFRIIVNEQRDNAVSVA